MQVEPTSARRLCEVDTALISDLTSFRASPNRLHMAQALGLPDGKQAMALDGKYWSVWDCILRGGAVFSPCSAHLAYCAERQGKAHVVLNESPGKAFDKIAEGSPVFSPNGKILAYAALDGTKWKLLVNGGERRSYDSIPRWNPIFSSDSRHLNYGGWRSGNAYVSIDDTEYGPYDDLPPITTLPNIDIRVPIKPKVSPNAFSSDGRHWAFVAKRDDKWFVVRDGVEGKAYDEIVPDTLTFLSDGHSLVYAAVEAGHYLIARNDSEQIVEGRLHPCGLTVSPIGTAIAYIVQRQNEEYSVYWRDHCIGWYKSVPVGTLAISPDGGHLAFLAINKKGDVVVVVDGSEVGPFDSVRRRSPIFSQDSKSFAFAATHGVGRDNVVVNGRISIGPFNSIVDEGPIFVESEQVRFIAIKEGYVVAVEHNL